MQIKNMFEKQIDRDIKGVIKVGQSDEENVYQELDEYVVTKELLKHFRDFFNNYEKGVDGYTDKMGVWISGFFGSGKSHFLKILSYLLKNSTVEGKRAIEYFTDGKKIEDPMLIAEMTKAGTIESDVMLFNIDSKGSAKVGSGKEAIVFKLGRVSLTLNSQSLSLLSTNADELVRYITKREYVEKLLIDIRERATDGQIRTAKEVMKDYFGFTVSSDDDDKIMSSFKSRAKDKVEVYDDILVEYRINPKYPCKRLMEEARKRLAEILDINEPTEFFKTVDKKRDDLLDDAEDTAPVFDFFKGDQKKIFEEAVKNLAYFGNSKTYVSDQELLKVVEEIETIVKDSKPFGKIQRLPELNKRFEELHMGLLEKEATIMDPLVHDDFLKVKEVLDTKPFAEVLRPRINQRFDEIWEKLRTSSDIAAIKNIKLESDTLKIKCLDEIDEYERAHQPAPEPSVAPVVPGKEPIEPIPAPTKVKTKRRKNVSISNVAGARTYSIETEQDIDKFLSEMKQKLMNELEEDTIITLS